MSVLIKSRSVLKDSDLLNAPEETIIITINIEGAAGRGIALSMRERYWDVYLKYKSLCKQGKLTPNSLLTARVEGGKKLLLFPTKIHWREPSPPDLIIDNLDRLATLYSELGIQSLAIPPLGMANGKLHGKNKERVWNHMLHTFENMDIPCVIYQ